MSQGDWFKGLIPKEVIQSY